jgi:flagellar protein FliL
MADKEKEKKEPKKGMSTVLKLLLVFFVVVILGVGGFAGWKYYKIGLGDSKNVNGEQAVQKPGIWPMDSQIVNLMDNNGERYLKATIQIEVTSQDSLLELDLVKPKILDSILGLLSSKSYGDIAGFEGKQRLKDEIAMRLNAYLAKGQVRRVYFTEFLIQ